MCEILYLVYSFGNGFLVNKIMFINIISNYVFPKIYFNHMNTGTLLK